MRLLYLSSAYMGEEYRDVQDSYIDYLAEKWEGVNLLSAADQFKVFGKYRGWPDWVLERPRGYDYWRFEGFVLPAENMLLAKGLEEDDFRRERGCPGNINTVNREFTWLKCNGVTGEIVKGALDSDRVVKVVGPGMGAAKRVGHIKFDVEERINRSGRPYDQKIAYVYFE